MMNPFNNTFLTNYHNISDRLLALLPGRVIGGFAHDKPAMTPRSNWVRAKEEK
jgi:hypothetical protein